MGFLDNVLGKTQEIERDPNYNPQPFVAPPRKKKKRETLDWDNLSNQECPKCSALLEQDLNTHTWHCQSDDEDCNFKISGERFIQVTSNLRYE